MRRPPGMYSERLKSSAFQPNRVRRANGTEHAVRSGEKEDRRLYLPFVASVLGLVG